ncbi:Hint domain-containing protein [Cognatishimia sp.]|uniref:Hint domain-containing protein n=1 Tax=Cognatishimia sp. TaxID=2211648 RepID=UPI003519AD42
MPTNLIVNGTFDQGDKGWSGTDLETNHTENAYLGNGSANRVAEMDGQRGQTTVMEQSFDVPNPTATELTLDAALRNAALSDRGSDGFSVEILDSDGAVIASQTIFPEGNSFTSFSVPVDFPSAGTYTLRLTEIGDNDSLGPIIDNVALMICFVGDARIEMADGTLKPARDIQVGDRVATTDGPQDVRWVGRRTVSQAELRSMPQFQPVRIQQGALGCGLPERDLYVSRQHRMLVKSPVADRMFGRDEVLVSAIRMVGRPGIECVSATGDVDYVHFLFDRHAIVFAEGAPSESLLVRRETLASLAPAARAEIGALFPDLVASAQGQEAVRIIPRLAAQNTLIDRLKKNERPMLEISGLNALRKPLSRAKAS